MTDNQLITNISEGLKEAGDEIVSKSNLPEVGSEVLSDGLTLKLYQMTHIRKQIFCTIKVVVDKQKNLVWQIQMSKLGGNYLSMEPIIEKAISSRFQGIPISNI